MTFFRTKSPLNPYALISMLLFMPVIASCATSTKAGLDAEVKRLCAIDGGVKVYETVKLPAERFDGYGRVHIPSKEQAKLEDEYYFEFIVTYLRKGAPDNDGSDASVDRSQFRVFRAKDGKLLGERISYSRRGGDLPGPWHPSSFTCPDPKTATSVEKLIFVNGESK